MGMSYLMKANSSRFLINFRLIKKSCTKNGDSFFQYFIVYKCHDQNYLIKSTFTTLNGHCWLSATGHTIPNEGTLSVPALTTEGKYKSLSWQVGDITRPLLSVGELCDTGKRVTFGRAGGYIQVYDPNTGQWEVEHPFARRGHMYELDVLVPPATPGTHAQGFPRQGQ